MAVTGLPLLYSLGQPPSDALDAVLVRGVGRRPLRYLNIALLVHAVHPLPESDSLARVIARLGHHHQPDIIGLALLHAPHGPREQQAQQVAAKQPAGDEHERGGGEEHEGGAEEEGLPDGLRQALAKVLGEVVGDLVAEHGGQLALGAGEPQDAAVDKDLAPRQDEGVGGGAVVDDVHLPLDTVLAVGIHAAHGDQPRHDAPHHQRARVPVAQEARPGPLHLVDEPPVLHVRHLPDRLLRVAVEAPAPGHGHHLEVVVVEGHGEGDGHDHDGVGARRAQDRPGVAPEEGLRVAQAVVVPRVA